MKNINFIIIIFLCFNIGYSKTSSIKQNKVEKTTAKENVITKSIIITINKIPTNGYLGTGVIYKINDVLQNGIEICDFYYFDYQSCKEVKRFALIDKNIVEYTECKTIIKNKEK